MFSILENRHDSLGNKWWEIDENWNSNHKTDFNLQNFVRYPWQIVIQCITQQIAENMAPSGFLSGFLFGFRVCFCTWQCWYKNWKSGFVPSHDRSGTKTIRNPKRNPERNSQDATFSTIGCPMRRARCHFGYSLGNEGLHSPRPLISVFHPTSSLHPFLPPHTSSCSTMQDPENEDSQEDDFFKIGTKNRLPHRLQPSP